MPSLAAARPEPPLALRRARSDLFSNPRPTGTTRAIKAGDTVEVEVEGVGVLRNRVVQR